MQTATCPERREARRVLIKEAKKIRRVCRGEWSQHAEKDESATREIHKIEIRHLEAPKRRDLMEVGGAHSTYEVLETGWREGALVPSALEEGEDRGD